MASAEELRAVKRRHSLKLLSKPGVSGVGVEKDKSGRYFLTIHLDSDDPELRSQLPDQIEGHPVKFVRSGPFRKLPRQGKKRGLQS
jgi:hypothetical protein